MKNTFFSEVHPVTGQKSFYGKALEYADDSGIHLLSYGVNVANIDNDGNCKVNGLYSATTTKHIKSWLTCHGFEYKDSKDIIKRYC